jgi:hypothetical protein
VWRQHSGAGLLWRIKYSDGDSEDVNERTVRGLASAFDAWAMAPAGTAAASRDKATGQAAISEGHASGNGSQRQSNSGRPR